MRFVAKTNHVSSGFMHFKTTKQNVVQHFRTSPGPQGLRIYSSSEYTLYDNHTAILPQNTDRFFEVIGDDYAMTELPFLITANGGHYGMRVYDSYWNVDQLIQVAQITPTIKSGCVRIKPQTFRCPRCPSPKSLISTTK